MPIMHLVHAWRIEFSCKVYLGTTSSLRMCSGHRLLGHPKTVLTCIVLAYDNTKIRFSTLGALWAGIVLYLKALAGKIYLP
jgi:hypothetical protein